MSVSNARALFAAARDDGPHASERDALFRKIAVTTGLAAGTVAGSVALSAVPAASPAALASVVGKATTSGGALTSSALMPAGALAVGSKLLALGVALGAATAVLGVLVAVNAVRPEAPSMRTTRHAPSVALPVTAVPGAKRAHAPARKKDVTASVAASANRSASPSATAPANASLASDLSEEATIVTAARNALVAGDAARALTIVQATRNLSARSLEPEELGLEARALRALGRADDAAATELVLRRRYPEHALSR